MVSVVKSMGLRGIDSHIVEIETDVSFGVPSFDLVGLPDAAVREARDRVRAALSQSGFEYPRGKVVINLAPAAIKKEGAVFDLPILVGLMVSGGGWKADISDSVFVGELSLKGEVRPVNGLLSMALKALGEGVRSIYVPSIGAAGAAVVEGIDVYPVENVAQLARHLTGQKKIQPLKSVKIASEQHVRHPDFADVSGQDFAKSAIEIACAGGHNVLLIGPPGSGKSMIAKRIPGVLPDMTSAERIEASRIHSVAGMLGTSQALLSSRPFRAPHHTVSAVALSGGGSTPSPGEISLAHNGVLFLDELPEFDRVSMETLRQPLEDGIISIARVAGTLNYPCKVMFVAAMNPCPCGFFGHPTVPCKCSRRAVEKYLGRVSGPLLDRIDIQVEVPPVKYDELTDGNRAESSADIKKRVDAARAVQQKRFSGSGVSCNAGMTTEMLREFCTLEEKAGLYLKDCFERLGMSGRAYDRILKVARTVADSKDCEKIQREHIAKAIRLRSLDKYF